jgi:Xaa-Pro aminopeptidase
MINISQKSEDTLTSGMVVTVEPGVYRRGWGGIRIEDMAVVSDYGCRVLTRLPKDIESAVIG